MKVATGYVVATVVVVGGLIWFLTRAPTKLASNSTGSTTGTGSSTTNAVLGFGTALAGLAGKLMPKSSGAANLDNNGPGIAYTGSDYGAGTTFALPGGDGAIPADLTPDNPFGTG
jgi:hypothetical protein